LNAARCYYELKELDLSLEYAGMAKKLDPNKPETEVLMGDLYEAKKDHTEAINAYRRALEMEGNSAKIMVPLSAAYLRSGRFSAAKELLADVVGADPNNALAHQYLGFAQLKLKETEEAVESYKRAAAMSEGDWMAHKGLGVAYMLLALKNNNDPKLEAMAMEQWGISLQLKSDQPKLQSLMDKYK
jgi:tetratricopeptide (TPR) repeat protein